MIRGSQNIKKYSIVGDIYGILNWLDVPRDESYNNGYRFDFNKYNPSVALYRLPYKKSWQNGQIVGPLGLRKTSYIKPTTRTFDHIIMIEGSAVLTTIDKEDKPESQIVDPNSVIIVNAWASYVLEPHFHGGTKDITFLAITNYIGDDKSHQPFLNNDYVIYPSLQALANLAPNIEERRLFNLSNVADIAPIPFYKSCIAIKITGNKIPELIIDSSIYDLSNCVMIVVSGRIRINLYDEVSIDYTGPRESPLRNKDAYVLTSGDMMILRNNVRRIEMYNDDVINAYVMFIKPSGFNKSKIFMSVKAEYR
jgi:hypothetical protein